MSELIRQNKLSQAFTKKITVLVVDDYPLLREALRTELEKEQDIRIIGEACNGKEAVEMASNLNPDIVVMDIEMPVMNGFEATRRIKDINSEIKVLVLTIHNDYEHIYGIFEAGADGYLTKNIFGMELTQAIKAQFMGETVISPQIFKQLFQYTMRNTTKSIPLNAKQKLTVREIQILKLLARGMNNKDIAENLKLSPLTIKSRLVDIFCKLNADSRIEAVIAGLRIGIITLTDIE